MSLHAGELRSNSIFRRVTKKSQITRDVDPTLQSVVDFVLEWIGCRSIIVKSETRSLEKDADCDNRERDDSSACKINTEFLSLMCGIEWHEIPIADGVSLSLTCNDNTEFHCFI